jgi:hypothetical protein
MTPRRFQSANPNRPALTVSSPACQIKEPRLEPINFHASIILVVVKNIISRWDAGSRIRANRPPSGENICGKLCRDGG